MKSGRTRKHSRKHSKTKIMLTDNQNAKNPQQETKENLQTGEKLAAGIITMTTLLSIKQLTIEEIQKLNLNIRIIKFLKLLGQYNKLKIVCHKQSCADGCLGRSCRSNRSHEVIGINKKGEEHLIMTASQEDFESESYGYMLVFKSKGVIFGSLGYQINPIYVKASPCCECKGGCSCSCCCCFCTEKENEKCCCAELCAACCFCFTHCCKDGGCCVGGCCTEGGCCCCCEEGCCVGGCFTCCNCLCFANGCCSNPCCKKGCCPCPNYQKILLDVRFLNTMEEALTKDAGLYVTTLYSPVDVCGCFNQNIGYKKCGERFALENKCCSCNNIDLAIMDLTKKEQVGNAKQNKTVCFDVESYEVELPKYAHPLEKLLIISEIFMFVYLKWDEEPKYHTMILTKKRLIFPGLEPNFS